jgi:hypothetical protein
MSLGIFVEPCELVPKVFSGNDWCNLFLMARWRGNFVFDEVFCAVFRSFRKRLAADKCTESLWRKRTFSHDINDRSMKLFLYTFLELSFLLTYLTTASVAAEAHTPVKKNLVKTNDMLSNKKKTVPRSGYTLSRDKFFFLFWFSPSSDKHRRIGWICEVSQLKSWSVSLPFSAPTCYQTQC